MNPSTWVRDWDKVKKCLVTNADKSVMTTKAVKIYIPERYREKSLAEIGTDTYILGMYALVVEDKYYAVSNVCGMVRIKPSSISTVKYEGESYLEFSFDPGSVVIATTSLVRDDVLVYRIFHYFIAGGRVPFYMDYDDACQLFKTADKHANVRLARSRPILEMFAATISRDPKKRTEYYRHSLPQGTEAPTFGPAFVAMRDVTMGPTNTTARLQGAYWNDALTSALVNPSSRPERFEQLLRA